MHYQTRMLPLAAFVIAFLFSAQPVAAVKKTDLFGSMPPEVRAFSISGSQQAAFLSYARDFKGGVRVALGDLDGDGEPEIITGAGAGGGPEVRVFNANGTLRFRFFAYGRGFRGGVNVAAFDLNGDNRDEIVTAPRSNGGPEVRVFDQSGRKQAAFFAFDRGFKGGVNIAAGAFGGHREPLIAAGSGYGGNHIRFFTPSGKFAGLSFRPFSGPRNGVVVSNVPVPGKRSLLAVAEERSSPPVVKLYALSNLTSPKKSLLAFEESFAGGVQIAAADTDSDGESEIVVGTGPGSTPRVAVIAQDGVVRTRFRAFDASFRGGVSVAASRGTIITGPGAVSLDGRTDLYKYIEVDLTDQTLKYFQNGRLIGTHHVSTGKWQTPTPIGTFALKNKIPVAYSKPYDLYMEWWMAFSPDGSYGIHGLPYWLRKDGSKYYEGVGHIGTPVSHGCIRQTLAEAKRLFDWADVGVPVIVHR